MNKTKVLTLSNEYIVRKCFFMSFYHCYELRIDSVYTCFRSCFSCESVNSLSIAQQKVMRFVRDNKGFNIDNFTFWFVVYTYDRSDNHLIDSYCLSLTGFAREYKNKLEVKKV